VVPTDTTSDATRDATRGDGPPERGAVRASYDRLAAAYAARYADELAHKPFDRALLDELAGRLRGAGPVMDVGCGPGHVAAYLRARGVDARGLDLSPGMVAQARALHPGVPYEVGDVMALDAADGAWGGAVALYSLIHLPRGQVAAALRELRRVLSPGAPLLVAFHLGEGVHHFDALWDVSVDLDFVFFTADEMLAALAGAGFELERREERDPYPDVEARTRRCYVLSRAASGPASPPRAR
jgi:SAM-dependent methyltransferase